MSDENTPDITTLTVQLLSAFVSNNSVPSESLAELIRTTRTALTDDASAGSVEAQAATFTPAVSARKSLSSPDHILSMIDGKPYKTLKRHLATHGLSPDEYRARYNLPKSYPLVAPSYSEARRAVATRLGLGRKPVAPAKAASPVKAAAETKASAPAKAAPAAKTAAKAATAKPSAPKAAKPATAKAGKPAAAKSKAPAKAAKASKAAGATGNASAPEATSADRTS